MITQDMKRSGRPRSPEADRREAFKDNFEPVKALKSIAEVMAINAKSRLSVSGLCKYKTKSKGPGNKVIPERPTFDIHQNLTQMPGFDLDSYFFGLPAKMIQPSE